MLSSKFVQNNQRKVISTENVGDFEKYKSENSGVPIIGTHSGTFHGDEVLATLLLKFHPKFLGSIVVRSRNPSILNQCDLVCDVGGEYNPTTLRFDHHMKEFTETYENEHKIKMSSAGLIFKHFGEEIITNILKNNGLYEKNEQHINELVAKVYENFIMMVDATDNGINAYPSDIKPKFLNHTAYSSRIARLNPEWNSVNVDINSRFKAAWDIAEEELYYSLNYLANGYYEAFDIVTRAVQNRQKVDERGKVIILEKFCPWKEILFEVEKKEKTEGQIFFVLFLNQSNEFTMSTVPIELGNFKFRKGLPKEWRGLRDDKLKEVSGINDIIFVHSSGFIGATKSYESSMKAVKIALAEKEEDEKNEEKV